MMKPNFSFRKMLFAAALVFASVATVKAQDDDSKIDVKDFSTMSLEQLEAHRSQLMALANSEDYQKKIHKLDEMKTPNDSGIQSLDEITNLLGKIAAKVRENRGSVSSMYAGVTGMNYDGSAATATAVNEQQLRSLSEIMLQLNGDIISTAKSLVSIPGEIKGAGALKAIKGLKNLMYIKNAVSALSAEIKYNNQLTQNLVATQKIKLAAK